MASKSKRQEVAQDENDTEAQHFSNQTKTMLDWEELANDLIVTVAALLDRLQPNHNSTLPVDLRLIDPLRQVCEPRKSL